jgi:hypothetical protein
MLKNSNASADGLGQRVTKRHADGCVSTAEVPPKPDEDHQNRQDRAALPRLGKHESELLDIQAMLPNDFDAANSKELIRSRARQRRV